MSSSATPASGAALPPLPPPLPPPLLPLLLPLRLSLPSALLLLH